MTATDTIKQELVQQERAREAEPLADLIALRRTDLERKIPTGTLTYSYAEAALWSELRRVPKLRECDPGSVLGAFAYGLQLGLVPGPLGHIYLVPFKNKGRMEATPIIGYKGYADLAFRSGKLRTLKAHVVREGDDFDYEEGTKEYLRFKPLRDRPDPDERAWTDVWALAHLTNGGKPFVVLSPAEVEARRKRSASQSFRESPWNTDTETMWRKSAVRELAQRGMLPLSTSDVVAVARDEGEPIDLEADALADEVLDGS